MQNAIHFLKAKVPLNDYSIYKIKQLVDDSLHLDKNFATIYSPAELAKRMGRALRWRHNILDMTSQIISQGQI